MIEWISISSEIDIAHIGPPLDKGRLPSVFYLALSAEESLTLDPFNQPALFLANQGVRVFSLNLPAHGPELSAIDAIGVWANEFANGNDLITPFIDRVAFAIDALIQRGLIVKDKIGLMGLSRGGFMALHTLAKAPYIHSVVGYAPLIKLEKTKEFSSQNVEITPELKLDGMLERFIDQPIRFYIGNRDIRVGTSTCFDFTHQLVDASFKQGIRSAPVELFISPSIGHMGHGTSKEIFIQGATWLAKQLGEMR